MTTPESSSEDAPAVRVPPPLVFLAAIVLALVLGHFHPRAPWPSGPFPRLLGAVSILYGAWLAFGALGLFKARGQNPVPWTSSTEIVTTGPYGQTRNPMYVGMASITLGLGYVLGNGWFSLTSVGAVLIVHRFVVLREEAYLERKFGEAYLAYKRKVRRWL